MEHPIDPKNYVGLTVNVRPQADDDFCYEFTGRVIGVRNGFLQVRDAEDQVHEVEVGQVTSVKKQRSTEKAPVPEELVRSIESACRDILDVLANAEDPRVTGRRPESYGTIMLTRPDQAKVRRAVQRLQNSIKGKAAQ